MEFADILSLGSNPFQVFGLILRNGGLVLFFPILVWGCWTYWKAYIQNNYAAKINWVLLAIDVPKLNEQSMAGIERIMEALHGVHFGPNKKEKYWIGVLPEMFSLEIVSIDGYIQYFVRTADYNVDLVKGAFFAQYPDAEIVEVEDYVDNVPQHFPNDEGIDMWGTEFVLAKPEVYPIKTYEFFEHSLTGIFADPMAALLELLSRLRPGEQVWLQFIITPTSHTWRESGLKEVADLIEKKIPTKKDMTDRVIDITRGALGTVHDALWTVETSGDSSGADENPDGKWMSMTTGDKIIVEEIQKKISRMGFKTKFRFIYMAPKEVMSTYRVVGSALGAIKQFSTLDLNAFTTGSHLVTSKPTYGFVQRRRNWRKRKLMLGYKYRSNWSGESPYVLSTTELATLFHFPTEVVKAPLVAKAVAKKAEPPSHLPVEETPFEAMRKGHQRIVVEAEPEPAMASPTAPAPAEPGAELPGVQGEPSGAPTPVPTPPAPPVERATPAPPPAVPVVAPPPAQPSAHEGADYPLHSMPGLPPGVTPIGQPLSAQSAQVAPQHPLEGRPQRSAPAQPQASTQPPTQPPSQPTQRQNSGQGGVTPTNLPL